ncbi:MAG TPA: ABC transporter permease [Rectinemataceae bacterium]
MLRAEMAIKNTLRQPRRSLLLGGAITFGIAVICLVASFSSGMESAVQSNVTLISAGHIIVGGTARSASGRAIFRIEDPELIKAVTDLLPEALSVSPTAQAQATVVFGSREQQLKVRGVDWEKDKLYSSSLILLEGDWNQAVKDRGILMGAMTAKRFGLGLGDSVFVRLSTVTGQQNVMEYDLSGVYDDSAAGGMSTVFVPLSNLLSDLNLSTSQYQLLAVFLPDASRADALAERLERGLEARGYSLADTKAAEGWDSRNVTRYSISTVSELSGQAGAVLGSVRWIGAAIFAIMVLLVMAGISNTYRMVLIERTKEIGMLRCIGFRRKDIFGVFILEALFISLAGSLVGILVSFPIGFGISSIAFNPSGDLGVALSRGRLLFLPQAASYVLASACLLAAGVLAVYGPAHKASRLAPAEALRVSA